MCPNPGSMPQRSIAVWCGRRDSNPHDFHHRNLNPARLPVPPRPLEHSHEQFSKNGRRFTDLAAAKIGICRIGIWMIKPSKLNPQTQSAKPNLNSSKCSTFLNLLPESLRLNTLAEGCHHEPRGKAVRLEAVAL
jgi:hypothetical protein